MATPRELLAAALRQSRTDAGYASHQSLARRLHVSRPVVSKAENPGQPVPSDPLLVSWAEATGGDLQKFEDFARRAKSGTPDWFVPYLAAEAQATMHRCWSPMIVPGLLQTRAYAYDMCSVEPYAPDQLDELVNTRMERQHVLERARFVGVLDYSVPQRMIGSPQVMAEQCAHLVEVAGRPTVSLHVVPENTNTGVWSELDIATRDSVSTVCMVTLRDVTSTATDLVDDAMAVFERILGCAMPRVESLEFLRTQEEQWKTRI